MPMTDTPIRKELRVPVRPDRAFALFTHEIAAWWPTRSHSVGAESTVDVRIEGWVGGRCMEVTRDGDTHLWGTILAWEPPRRIVLTWHPGGDPDDPSEVEVRFEPEDDGCRVVLEHRGWERPSWTARRGGYDSGWDQVLGCYAAVARRGAALPMEPGVS